jgi:NAD(P)-dependent dehydrogenase (short-subunit alcohol dehydrogenase family)
VTRDRRVAFVTGASRGIGRASAIALADAGFDVVVTARTMKEGESADGRPLPGSVETTAEAVREHGAEALALPLDLLDRASMEAALEATFAQWGRIDLLLNNGVYTGPGSLVQFLDLDLDEVETLFRANVFSQIFLTQRVLPHMLERGDGSVINMVSAAGMSDPPAPADQGGWGYAYGASKAAFLRMAGVLAVEHPRPGLRFFNLEPGFVVTEAMKLNDPEGRFSARFGGAPPEVPAAVVAWLAASPAASEWNGKTVSAQKLCRELGLHPEWRPQAPRGSDDD